MPSKLGKGIEITLCILKPHISASPPSSKAIQKLILNNGFYVIETKVRSISKEEASEFYKEHIGKFFFNRLLTFMTSGPCIFHILAKENAIKDWRSLLGPTKVYRTQFTHPLSIRALYGLTDTRNAAHGSDSVTAASREISVFFPRFDSTEWLRKLHENQFTWNEDLFVHQPS